ncbi:MAG: response regulator [Chloroflexota bacterium]
MSLVGKNIFIVEDDPMNRIVYQITLAIKGANLEFDSHGQQVLKKLQAKNHWDLIILDLMLGRHGSGYDIYSQVKANPNFANTPIIAISASEPAVAIPKVRELGFNGFISKPIDEEIFADQIESIINGESVWHDGTVSI